MPLVVLLKGINVGGHRRFRPSLLANDLKHLDVVSIGAAGTFVVRKRVSRATLRDEISRRVPFEVDVMICEAREVERLAASDPFGAHRPSAAIVQFVSLVAKPPRGLSTPFSVPSTKRWTVKVLECRGRFIVGLYRRQMSAIGHLQRLERILGGPAATRNWGTIQAVVRNLG